jgi:hypothetical protein
VRGVGKLRSTKYFFPKHFSSNRNSHNVSFSKLKFRPPPLFDMVLDCMAQAMHERFQGNRSTLTIFQVLDFSQGTFESNLNELSLLYKDDVNGDDFIAQMKFFTDYYISEIVPNTSTPGGRSPKDIFSYIFRTNLHTNFPAVYQMYQIFCAIPVTTAQGERNFSKLNLVKSYMRSTMTQERLNSLAILSIERLRRPRTPSQDKSRTFFHKK